MELRRDRYRSLLACDVRANRMQRRDSETQRHLERATRAALQEDRVELGLAVSLLNRFEAQDEGLVEAALEAILKLKFGHMEQAAKGGAS